MSTIQIANITGGLLVLQQGPNTLGVLPSGFTGSLQLEGVVAAYSGNVITTTNIVPAVTNNLGTCGVLNYINQTPYAVTVGVDLAPNPNTSGMMAGNPIQYSYADSGVSYANAVLPNAAEATYVLTSYDTNNHSFTGGLINVVPWQSASPGQTNYTTQTQGGSALGQFTAGPLLKAVSVHPQGITETSYAMESEAVAVGFGFAFTVLVFTFLLRLLRAIPTQGGDL